MLKLLFLSAQFLLIRVILPEPLPYWPRESTRIAILFYPSLKTTDLLKSNRDKHSIIMLIICPAQIE